MCGNPESASGKRPATALIDEDVTKIMMLLWDRGRFDKCIQSLNIHCRFINVAGFTV